MNYFNKVKVLISKSNCIFKNLAMENYIFENYKNKNLEDPHILFYTNDKTIVIGRHQNAWKECHLTNMNRDDIILCRRNSGGGAVYQDLGNLCFSFITPIPKNILPLDMRDHNNKILINSLNNLNINAELKGRNDILYKDKKFSGSAYQVKLGGKNLKPLTLHHGTILYDIKINKWWDYLNPNKDKLKSKGIESIISRVINLKDDNPDLKIDQIQENIISEFLKYHSINNQDKEEIIINDPIDYNPEIKTIYEKLKEKNWNLNFSPKFTYEIEKRFDWGSIELLFNVKDGILKSTKIFSDILYPEIIDSLESYFNSKEIDYNLSEFELVISHIKYKYRDNKLYINILEDINELIKEKY